ncbi:MAG: hypothetical protein JWM53_2949, partial [bacterium]|nr:hypothetical protein [bacterium]
DKDKHKKDANGAGAQAHGQGGGSAGSGAAHDVAGHEAAHADQQRGHGGGDAGADGPAEKPAAISAKFIGVGRKIHRNPKSGAASAPAPSATPPAATPGGTPAALTAQTPEQTLTSTEYKTFQGRYNALMAGMQMPADAAAAQKIWLDMVRTLQATDAAYKAAPTAPNSPRKDMSVDAFKAIMKQFDPIINAMTPMMEKFTKGKKIWAFWSGNCACDIAKANSEVSLEKSALGGLFDGININGGWDIQMWASLSRAYATHAAKDAEQKTYRGFVGKGSSAEQSIFNKVEQPQFMGMLDQKAQASLKITWYACAADPKDAKMKTPDPTCNVAGMAGVMGSGSDRGSMVAMAETVNEKRAQVYAKMHKVVPPDQADAALAEAEKAEAEKAKAAAGGSASATPAAGGAKAGGGAAKPVAANAALPAASSSASPAAPKSGPKKS